MTMPTTIAANSSPVAILRSASRARSVSGFLSALVLLTAMGVATAHAEGTPEQRRACRADAMKFCREFVPNVKRITACMEANKAKLSPLCRTQFK